MKPVKHIVMFSGGIGSWAAARRVRDKVGARNMVLLFTDTLVEDEDLYRFLYDAAADIGAPFVRIADGRTPWGVFFDVRFLGNTRVDPCSKILKRDLADSWVKERFSPSDCVLYVGIDWSEINRFEKMAPRKLPYEYQAPLSEPPFLSKHNMISMAKEVGLTPPRLYEMGFPHNNCGGFCVKAGQKTFKLLLDNLPERYKIHETQEMRIRRHLLNDISILRDRRGGKTKPMTLRAFRKRLQNGGKEDPNDYGGCGCFLDDEDE